MLDTVLGAQKQTVNKMETNPSVMGSILEAWRNEDSDQVKSYLCHSCPGKSLHPQTSVSSSVTKPAFQEEQSGEDG